MQAVALLAQWVGNRQNSTKFVVAGGRRPQRQGTILLRHRDQTAIVIENTGGGQARVNRVCIEPPQRGHHLLVGIIEYAHRLPTERVDRRQQTTQTIVGIGSSIIIHSDRGCALGSDGFEQPPSLIVNKLCGRFVAIDQAVAAGIGIGELGDRAYLPAKIITGVTATDSGLVLAGDPGNQCRFRQGRTSVGVFVIGNRGHPVSIGVVTKFAHTARGVDTEPEMVFSIVYKVTG